MGPSDSLHFHGDNSPGIHVIVHGRGWRATVRTGLRPRLARIGDCDVEFETSRREHVSKMHLKKQLNWFLIIHLSHRSFFQSVCVLGYCLTPVVMALLVCKVILFMSAVQTKLWFFLRLVTTMAGFTWATFAAFVFLGESQPKNRKPLAVYPIFLFYFVISWLVISHSNA